MVDEPGLLLRVIKSFYFSWVYGAGSLFGVGVAFLSEEVNGYILFGIVIVVYLGVEAAIRHRNENPYVRRKRSWQFLASYINATSITSMFIERVDVTTAVIRCILLLILNIVVVRYIKVRALNYQQFEPTYHSVDLSSDYEPATQQVNDDCAICLDSLEQGEIVRLKNCSHHYHTPCIQSWLTEQRSCPQCRTSTISGSTQTQTPV